MSEFEIGTRVRVAGGPRWDAYNGIEGVVGTDLFGDLDGPFEGLENIFIIPDSGYDRGIVDSGGFYWHTDDLEVIS